MARAKLMIVEDDRIVAMDLRGILQSLGYSVCAVASRGEEAIDKAIQTRPDLVLMDIRLQGDMDGIEAAEQLRAHLDTPVVFLTAYADETTLARAKLTSPLAYVLKPFNDRELHSAIEVALYRGRMERQLRESEARFRTLVENIPVGMFRTTSDLPAGFLMANPAFLRMFGFDSQEELTGGHAVQIFADPQAANHLRDTLLTQGSVAGIEHQLRKKDGSLFWAALTLTAVRDDHGDIQYVDGIVEDITERKQARESLRRARREWENIFQAIGHPALILDSQHRILAANRAAAEAVGRSEQQLLGERCCDLFHGTNQPPASCPLQDMLVSRHLETTEIEMEAIGGTYLVSCTPVLDDQGNLDKVIHIATDITDLKQAEEEVQRRVAQQIALNAIIAAAAAAPDLQELLKVTLDHTLEAFDLEMGGIWIPPYAAVRALPSRLFRAMHHQAEADSLSGPIAVTDWRQIPADSRFSAMRPAMERVAIHASLTLPIIAEGQRLGSLSLAAPEPHLWSDEEIALAETVGQQLVVTAERLGLLEKIRQQAQQMQQIMDTVPEGVLLLDSVGQILLSNPLGTRYLAALTDAQEGDALTHLGDRSLGELLATPPAGHRHEVTANGQVFQILAQPVETAFPSGTPPPGPAEGWVLIIRDVTQQREVERRIQQQERLASVGQLAAGIAHDFKNILATIILYSQIAIQADGLSARDREHVATISQQARHATRLIEQILDFSHRADLERRPLDLRLFLSEQVKLLQRTLPESIEVKLSYEPGQHTVNADPTRLQQAITNLAVNARDAMPGGGTLHIALERITVRPGELPPLPEMTVEGAVADEWVQVTISDTGKGIPPDALPHIFDPFYTTKPPGEGAGLGLAQVHGIVGQHDGHIDVRTQLNHGTTFIIYLPALRQDSSESRVVGSLQEPLILPHGHRETILVVEDDSIVKRVLARSLEDLNYQVLTAENGSKALELLERHKEIALVLSDVVMPKMGGIPLLHAMKERGLQVGMVMLTGHPLDEELDELRAEETASLLVDWLAKPVRLEQLAGAVDRALKARDYQ
jgi:two-component system cell cycle sensor histidine kinase/response regulator CckA